jgi:NTE family protein
LIDDSDQNIALALSGGGIRAMVFHLGVLRFLAENRALERVSHISTVSGGSLIVGLLLNESHLQWPTSTQYLNTYLPSIRNKLCSKSLMMGMLRQLLYPSRWRFLLSRANYLAFALRDEWGVIANLSDLPTSPQWSINGTTAETGKRFRFKRQDFGDYILGYAPSINFPLASALAVSAAFPGGIGPLAIAADNHSWTKRDWDAPEETAKGICPAYPTLHLYDGGVYDNLGLEPFFDAGLGMAKKGLPDNTLIIVSDAGAPLTQGFSFSKLNPWRIKRVADIMSDQSRALRIRTFYNYLSKNKGNGGYCYIGQPTCESNYCESASFASHFPTTLSKMSEVNFDRIEMHGYKVAKKFYEDNA